MVRLKKTDGLIYEYACHEGNYSMTGILAGGARGGSQGGREEQPPLTSVSEHALVFEREP